MTFAPAGTADRDRDRDGRREARTQAPWRGLRCSWLSSLNLQVGFATGTKR